MSTPIISIIGAGHLGTSLLGGLISKGYSPKQIWIANPSAKKLADLREKWAVEITENNKHAAEKADVVILAVKPNVMPVVTQEIAGVIQKKKPLVISVAAGVREKSLRAWLGEATPVVRCMPNTPALIGCAASALFANTIVSKEQREQAESILRAVGTVVWLESEELMDAVTALSGCGPAYFFLVIEALQSAGEKLGLPAETARLLALQTAYGASKMALESDYPASELRRQVMSPGGATEKAVGVLEEKNIRAIFFEALFAAKKRSEELALQK